jgi:hypothetical protein
VGSVVAGVRDGQGTEDRDGWRTGMEDSGWRTGKFFRGGGRRTGKIFLIFLNNFGFSLTMVYLSLWCCSLHHQIHHLIDY